MKTAACHKSVTSVLVEILSVIEHNIAIAVGDSSLKTHVGMVGIHVQCDAVFFTVVV